MHRTRTIAAAPVRSADEAWQVVKQLLIDTLERSPNVPDGSVDTELAALSGLLPALIAGGHVSATPIVLVDGDLHLSTHVVRGDEALTLDENVSPVPGGASASAGWKVYVSPPAHMEDATKAACAANDHVVCGKPSEQAAQVKTASRSAESATIATEIDIDALRRFGGR